MIFYRGGHIDGKFITKHIEVSVSTACEIVMPVMQHRRAAACDFTRGLQAVPAIFARASKAPH